jgi:signal transduction histidine kinase
MGLVTMRRRAEALGGELTIDSKPGRGTRIELSFDALGRRGPRVRWRRRRNVPNRRLSDGPSK